MKLNFNKVGSEYLNMEHPFKTICFRTFLWFPARNHEGKWRWLIFQWYKMDRFIRPYPHIRCVQLKKISEGEAILEYL